ncbi:hypothetical protein PHLH6_37620 [Pseudomonas sp. Seg1]|nr:hypothetical protein PHLH6_37620 [Pseudomonas sp. Seg1]
MNPGAKEPEPQRGPYVRVKPFWLLFRRLEKVTRRKGGTLISHTHSNGSTNNHPPNKKAPTNRPGLPYQISVKHQNFLMSA